MYAAFFGLQQEAFSIAPDPRFLHLSAGHGEALAHLLYGLQGGGGFVLLSGEIGTGKTTLCRGFLEQIPPGHRVAYLYNPQLTALELLQTICQEFGIGLEPTATTVKPCIDALNRFLLDTHARGEQCLLVVDEAQGLAPDLLELLRLLTNLETSERKLLQIVLIGQPELRTLLARPELEQLAQRIVARVHLGPLSAAETAAYVQHRMSVAGLQGPLPFSARALRCVHRCSGGVPRRINLLCQRALLGAYAQGQRSVDAGIVQRAAREVFDGEPGPPRRLALRATAVLLLALVGVAAAGWAWHERPTGTDTGADTGTGSGQGAGVGIGAASVPPAASTAAASTASAASGAMQGTLPRPFADPHMAAAALASTWGLDARAGEDACQAARRHHLACGEGRVDAELLRRLDRPLLLLLADGHALLLQAMGPEEAQLAGPAGTQRVALSTLRAAWDGQVLAWWRPPPGDVQAWVLERLTTLQGPDAPGASRAPADERLRRRVFAFQLNHGLPLDGWVGPLTLMQLNRASGVDEPHLKPQS